MGSISSITEAAAFPYSSNYSLFLTSKNERVRKSAFKKKHDYYKKHINTISSLYIGQVKSDVFYSKTRKYNSTLEAHLFSDNIDAKLYKNLVKITNKNTTLVAFITAMILAYLGLYFKFYEFDLVATGIKAGALVKEAAKLIQGGGGGQPHFATAGGKNPDGLQAAVDKAVEMIMEKVK